MFNQERPQWFLIGFDLFTLTIWAWLIVEFFSREAVRLPVSLTTIYIILLTFYATDKEIRRWRKKHRGTYHGELFVGLWVLTFVVIFLATQFISRVERYSVPPDLATISGSVVLIYVITDYLKDEFHRRYNGRNHR